jgi:hypothetical protein
MVAIIHARGERRVVNGHGVTSRHRRRDSAAGLLLPLCFLALLVPVFASRPAGDPIRLLVVALGAVCAFAAITARLVLRQSDARATGAAERLEATGHFRNATQSIDALLHEPGYRREFVVELHTSALDDATDGQPAHETVTSRSTGVRGSLDSA